MLQRCLATRKRLAKPRTKLGHSLRLQARLITRQQYRAQKRGQLRAGQRNATQQTVANQPLLLRFAIAIAFMAARANRQRLELRQLSGFQEFHEQREDAQVKRLVDFQKP